MIRCGERHSTKFCVKEMKGKPFTFYFLKSKAKKKAVFSKIVARRMIFLWKILVSSFKVNVYSLSFMLKSKPWSSGNVKQEVSTRNWTYELPHELPNNLGLMILENEERLRIFTWLFNDLMTRGFDLVVHGFELVTRGFKLALFDFNSCF